jgi:hypothetical protein
MKSREDFMPDSATQFETVTSADGTTIAYERVGVGTPLILVGEAFMGLTGMDDQAVAWARQAPFLPGMVSVAHTTACDLALTGDTKVPAARLASISARTLVMDGSR